jgi:hypothetical protein
MAMLLSILLTIGIAYWYYKTAERLNSNTVQWAIAGAIVYQLPAWAWMLLVSKPYLGSIQGSVNRSSISAMLIGHSWIAIGVIIALLVYKFALLKTSVKSS